MISTTVASFTAPLALVAEKFGGEQQKRGTNPLAAAGAQIFADLRDGRDVRDCVATELLFDRDDVVAQKVEDFFPVDGGRRRPNLAPLQLLR